MGTWGTGLKDSDTFADIYGEFFELYNKGQEPKDISKKILAEYSELLKIKEEKHDLWFALALAQWETKSLEPQLLSLVENIISYGDDLRLWRSLGASEDDVEERKVKLDKFLTMLKSPRSNPKARQKLKIQSPMFATGDCLVFRLKDGRYGGAVVLATDTRPESGSNLVATTRLRQVSKPSVADFKSSEVLICNFAEWKDKPDILWHLPDLYLAKYSERYELVGRIEVERIYDPNNYEGKGYLFKPSWTSGWTMNETADRQFEFETSGRKLSLSISIKQLIKKDRWWNLI